MFAQGNSKLINIILEYEIDRFKPLYDQFDKYDL